jgi:hypothetical protein
MHAAFNITHPYCYLFIVLAVNCNSQEVKEKKHIKDGNIYSSEPDASQPFLYVE